MYVQVQHCQKLNIYVSPSCLRSEFPQASTPDNGNCAQQGTGPKERVIEYRSRNNLKEWVLFHAW
jgi:hypothetical protein